VRRRRVLVVGGGCFGTHFQRRLRRARETGGEPFAIWVVDRDENCAVAAAWRKHGTPEPGDRFVCAEWSEFLRSYLSGPAESLEARRTDLLVPSPLAPHLFAAWLASLWGEHEVEREAFPVRPELPYVQTLPDGGLTLSHAAWRCPTHCIEPRLCPATRQIRDWDLSRSLLALMPALRSRVASPLVGPLLSQCVTWRQGVGVMPLADWLRSASVARSALRHGGHLLAATVSACHGVAHYMRVADTKEAGGPSSSAGS
jgi:hypothetical protein